MIDKNCYDWTVNILYKVFKNATLVVTDKIVQVIFNTVDRGHNLRCKWEGDKNKYAVDIFFDDKYMLTSFDWDSTYLWITKFHEHKYHEMQQQVDSNTELAESFHK